MEKGTILKEIKNLILKFGYDGKEKDEEKFVDAKVGDTIIRVEADDFAEGLQLLVVTDEGVIPAPAELAGEHVLEDGRVIVVNEGGIITEVRTATSEDETEENFEIQIEAEPKVDETAGMTSSVVEELEKRITDVEEMVKEMFEATKKTAEFSSIVSEKIDNFVKDTPAQIDFKSIKTEYNGKEDKKAGIENHLEKIRTLRKK